MHDYILQLVNSEDFESIKDYKLADIIYTQGTTLCPETVDLLRLVYEKRQTNIIMGLQLHPDTKDSIKFLKKARKEALRLIDDESMSVSLSIMLHTTWGEFIEKSMTDWSITQSLISNFLNHKSNFVRVLAELEELITPHQRMLLKLVFPFSETFQLVSKLTFDQTINHDEHVVQDEKLKENILILIKLSLLLISEYNFFQFINDKLDEIRGMSNNKTINGYSLAEIEAILWKELKIFIEPENDKREPISTKDYEYIVECMLHLLKKDSLPKKINRISRNSFTQKEIRKPFYKIHITILPGYRINDLFIDLIHALFVQFKGTEKASTKSHFSQ